MIRLVGAVALGMLATFPALAQKCKTTEEPIVRLVAEEESLRYRFDEGVSMPVICRGGLFTIEVTWNDDSIERFTFNNFRPLQPQAKRWVTLDNSDLPDLWHRRHISLIRDCEAPCSTSRKYSLASSWSWGVDDLVRVRLIQMKVQMALADGPTVSFPTMWGERS